MIVKKNRSGRTIAICSLAIYSLVVLVIGILWGFRFHPNNSFKFCGYLSVLISAGYGIYFFRKTATALGKEKATKKPPYALIGILSFTLFGYLIILLNLTFHSFGFAWAKGFGNTKVIEVMIMEKEWHSRLSGRSRSKECEYGVKVEETHGEISFKQCLDKSRWSELSAGDTVHARVTLSPIGIYVDCFMCENLATQSR